ncbi:MAG TPA: 7-carboxy-7-deazaguanine synthase [Vicinamibacterales bacterium]|nr:7-carboxy-7-deazaguanine synthase [Vicinamibacterales bacterium]
MKYRVKEIFYSLQGEGANSGRPAVFCRFAGCNLWSGFEADRAKAICRFCDTNFVGTDGAGGGVYEAEELADAVGARWPSGLSPAPFVVCTGGEPLLQLDAPLLQAFNARRFEVAVETNGTRPLPGPIDWVTVSPKSGSRLVLDRGHELKLVYPQDGIDPASFEGPGFGHFFLQPMDGPDRWRNTLLALDYCRQHPRWRLSIQLHKYLGLR